MFEIPTGYNCVTRQNDTTLYGYRNNTRDTYTLNGFHWQKTGTSTSSSLPNNAVCVKDPQISTEAFGQIIFASVIILVAFFAALYKSITGVFNSYLR